MDGMHWALLAAAVAGAALAAWLLAQRASGAGRLAAAEEAARRLEEDVRRRDELLAAREVELRGIAEKHARASEAAASLEASLKAANAARADEAARAEAAKAAAVRAAEERAKAERDGDRDAHRARVESLERANKVIEDRLKQYDTQVREAFGAIASKALQTSREEFLALAKQQFEKHAGEAGADLAMRQAAIDEMLRPMREALAKTETRLGEIEQGGAKTAGELVTRITQLQESERLLREETGNLVKALRQPQVRGRYGELQLRRVAEIAGMRAYCDFEEQSSTRDGEGTLNRPDMIVRLPNGRHVVVDAKTNIQPYLDALEAKDPARVEACLDAYANGVAKTAAALGSKSYWKGYDGAPEFVVMFVPGEQLIDAALARRPDLLEAAARQNVLLAGPGSLIALLRAVHLGFREQKISEEARAIRDLVTELHQRLAIALEKAAGVQRSLAGAVKSWNEFAGSVDGRLIPQVKKIESAGVKSSREVEAVGEIEATTRSIALLPVRGEDGVSVDAARVE
ncbi:MAG: DNA recombination protein RmuC [Planctomycetota bacterium]|nr:DNA recombination protein RmuC [Planctomycetota bacterium]